MGIQILVTRDGKNEQAIYCKELTVSFPLDLEHVHITSADQSNRATCAQSNSSPQGVAIVRIRSRYVNASIAAGGETYYDLKLRCEKFNIEDGILRFIPACAQFNMADVIGVWFEDAIVKEQK